MTAMPVTISDRAARRIVDIIKAEGRPAALRVAVTGGGCSGFQYNFALDEAQLYPLGALEDYRCGRVG